MASSKRKQDEKHLKMLREMVALAHNKQCFDCHQRGPTYVNMTIGSFVCTSCSGLLRGLNPPHRVKSISMTSFTPEEMDFLRCRGNDFCRRVWLGLFDSRSHMEPESKDENKRKDFMSQKYEKKRWYVAPTESMYEEARRQNTPLKEPNTTKPLKNLVGNSLPKLVVSQNSQPATATAHPKPVAAPPQASQTVQRPTPGQNTAAAAPQQQPAPQKSAAFDLLGDLGGDPFAGPQNTAPSAQQGGGFANFADFNSMGTQPGSVTAQQQPGAQTAAPPTSGALLQPLGGTSNQPPVSAQQPAPSFAGISAADRYAALADLDSVFGGGTTGSKPINWDNMGGAPSSTGWGGSGGAPSSSSVLGGSGTSLQANTGFGSAPNPFGTSTATATSTAVGNPFMPGGGATQASGSGFSQPQPVPGSFGQFGQPVSQAAFASFGTPPSANVAGMQNGGFGGQTQQQQQGQMGWGGVPQQGQMGQLNAFPTSGAVNLNAGATAQYNKMAQPGFGTQPTQQQFAGWGGQPQPQAANPFMNTSAQQPVPPRSGSTNPFL